MPTFQRSTWSVLFVLGLLPFVIALALTLNNVPKFDDHRIASTQSDTHSATRPATQQTTAIASAPLLAAGDAQTLWIVHPTFLDVAGKKIPVYELFASIDGIATWTRIRDKSGNTHFSNHPRGLVAISPPATAKYHANACAFGNKQGAVQVFSLSGESVGKDNLPPDDLLMATAGSIDGAFALTIGPSAASTTRPGDTLNLVQPPLPPQSYFPPTDTSNAPASSEFAATRPARQLVNVYWLQNHWIMLPSLGPLASSSSSEVPAPGALVAMAHLSNRIIVLWVNLEAPNVLIARSLDYRSKEAQWSKPILSWLPISIPPDSRLLPVVLDKTLYLFWPDSVNHSLQLNGGWMITNDSLDTDLKLLTKNFLPPLTLKTPGELLAPVSDVVIGPAENSIAVIVSEPDHSLVSFLFDNRGRQLAGPTSIKSMDSQRDVQFAQNIELLLLALMLSLSLWQWRQRPGPIKLSPGLVIASPAARAFAFLIDLAVPFLIISIVLGIWSDGDGYTTILSEWSQSILNFDNLFNSPPLLSFWGLYLLHVTIGELFFHRSIGKAFIGLQVLMIDGKPPTLAAILVRNLIRLPELLLGILVVYFFISGNRQRLGDLIARTIVVSASPPEVPEEKQN